MTQIEELVDITQTYYCLDCGVCTGSCPVAKVFPDFSPRLVIERSLFNLEEPSDPTIWDCLTCAQCFARCPTKINFPEFIRLIRNEAHTQGYDGVPAHSGMLQTITAIQTKDIVQQRTDWIGDGRTKETGDIFYFVGCRPFFEPIFEEIGAGSMRGPQNILKILNACGVEPVVSNEERCCGHDALWNGDEETFKRLAQRNIDTIRSSGAKQVLFSCPEGYYAFKNLYPKHFGELGFEPVHILDFLVERIDDGGLDLASANGIVTYHGPCRLGRMAGIFDAPRKLLQAMNGLELREMGRSRENGVCCGTTGWMNCSKCSGLIRLERLEEARETGAETLITACPKCQIHFRCVKWSYDVDMEIVDLYDLVADHLKGG